MEEISLGAPKQILESLPDDESAERDMRRASAGVEDRVNDAIERADEPGEAAGDVTDVIDRLETRMERYDEFVPELRAWGQSPIYAIAWRNLYADLVMQLYEYDWLATELERERNYRIADDGIRFGGT